MSQSALPVNHYPVQAANYFVTSEDPQVLAKIYETDIQLCILNRSLDIGTHRYATTLQAEHTGFQLIQPINPRDVKQSLETSLPSHQSRSSFIEDVSMLVDMFACLFELKIVGLRLNALNKTMCPRFHIDQVPCRLITTYAGRGTEWLESDDEIPPGHQAAIRSLRTGEIALFKGKTWENNHGKGAIHRSPALHPDESRILLTLDWLA